MPDGDMKILKKEYVKSGKWGKISAAHASNALVVVMKPEDGLYSLCTGPAIRGSAPISPDLVVSIYNERNTFWDIELKDSPRELVETAKRLAEQLIDEVKNLVENHPVSNKSKDVYEELEEEVLIMNELLEQDSTNYNKLIRVITRIHVISRQFISFFKVVETGEYE